MSLTFPNDKDRQRRSSALVDASRRAFRRWDALAVWRATAARATGPGVPRRQKSGVPQERGYPLSGNGGVRTSVSFLKKRVVCERNRDPKFSCTVGERECCEAVGSKGL